MSTLDLLSAVIIVVLTIFLALFYVLLLAYLSFAFIFLLIIDPILCKLYPKWRAVEPTLLENTNKDLKSSIPKGNLREIKKDE